MKIFQQFTNLVQQGGTGTIQQGGTGSIEQGGTGSIQQGGTGSIEQGGTGSIQQGGTGRAALPQALLFALALSAAPLSGASAATHHSFDGLMLTIDDASVQLSWHSPNGDIYFGEGLVSNGYLEMSLERAEMSWNYGHATKLDEGRKGYASGALSAEGNGTGRAEGNGTGRMIAVLPSNAEANGTGRSAGSASSHAEANGTGRSTISGPSNAEGNGTGRSSSNGTSNAEGNGTGRQTGTTTSGYTGSSDTVNVSLVVEGSAISGVIAMESIHAQASQYVETVFEFGTGLEIVDTMTHEISEESLTR